MKPYLEEGGVTLWHADTRAAVAEIPADSIDCVVTSPPYWGLRDYGFEGQIGLEPTPAEYVESLTAVFAEVRQVLKPEGTLWLNMGDCYATGTTANRNQTSTTGPSVPASWAGRSQPVRCGTPDGLKTKDLIGMPWMLAFALRAEGWYLRKDIIWSKPNPMPESVKDRPTSAHEYIFLMSKSKRYYYAAEALREQATDTGRINGRDGRDEAAEARPPGSRPRTLRRLDYSQLGRNARSVWTIAPQAFAGAHFATFPEKLAEQCIKAGCPAGGTVLDPFAGSGTVGLVARRLGCKALLIEGSEEYCGIASKRLAQGVLALQGSAS